MTTTTTTTTTTTPPSTPPLDAVAFASSLHQEVARLRAACLAQRAVLEAATAQLDALQVPQTERPTHHLGVMVKTAVETIPTLDDAASRLLAILQDVEKLRQQHADAQARSAPRPVAAPAYPALRDVAARLGMTKSFAVAVDSPSTKPAERYEFFKRLLAALSPQGRDAVVGADVAAELRQLYDATVDALPDLDEVAKALVKARDSWRRKGSLESEDLQQRLQRDLVFQKLDRHVQQMILLRRGVVDGSATEDDTREYRDLADLVLATLTSLPLPGGEVQGMVEAVVAEVRRLRGDCEVVATMRRLGAMK